MAAATALMHSVSSWPTRTPVLDAPFSAGECKHEVRRSTFHSWVPLQGNNGAIKRSKRSVIFDAYDVMCSPTTTDDFTIHGINRKLSCFTPCFGVEDAKLARLRADGQSLPIFANSCWPSTKCRVAVYSIEIVALVSLRPQTRTSTAFCCPKCMYSRMESSLQVFRGWPVWQTRSAQ